MKNSLLTKIIFCSLFFVSLIIISIPANAYYQTLDKNGNLVVYYFTVGDYNILYDRIVYSSTAKVPDGMNSITTNYQTGVVAVVTWYGDLEDTCRKFRGDLYYPNRSTPKVPKPELRNFNIPKSLDQIPVESYSGSHCKNEPIVWNNLKRTVNEIWTPGDEF